MKRRAALLRRLDERGLRALFIALFAALALPAAVLVVQAYGQLKWESFRNAQLGAEELAARIDADLRIAMAAEEARTFGDYAFLVVTGDPAANFVQRSPLSAFPVASTVPGVLGYFQVDAAGRLTTPLLPEPGIEPAAYGIGAAEAAERAALVAELRDVLAANRLVRQPELRDVGAAGGAEPAPPNVTLRAAESASVAPSNQVSAEPAREQPAPREEVQAAFDRLARAPAVLRQERPAAEADVAVANDAAGVDERRKRVEQSVVPAAAPPSGANDADNRADARVLTFESEVDPFEVGSLDTGHLVMFRNVWRGGQRYVQGALLAPAAFVAGAVEVPLRASAVGRSGDVAVLFQGRELATLAAGSASGYASSTRELSGTVLHRARLSPPFGDLELVFAVNALPRAPGTALLVWVSVVLGVVLCGGFWLMYRLAAGQMRLARQQQDFVSAVSHELKTPLTSIRMYGEMLRAGWADEAKKQTYYDYIHSESERLSRLIDNVLRLARFSRGAPTPDPKPVPVTELVDLVRSKVASQVERAGFELAVRNDAPADATVRVDADAFVQIFINLIDNALKFAVTAPVKRVELACRRESSGALLFTVRDFGSGVPKEQMKKIFELFYRAENELTRETVGTGIGLALVRQLAAAMGGKVDVRNCEPGAEFRVELPGV